MKKYYLILLASFSIMLWSCCDDSNPSDNSKNSQIDTVKICNQTWMKKNLNIDHYNNGDSIRHAENAYDWVDARSKKEGAWCYYNFNDSLGKIYGKLYNWYAVIDGRGLAPKGWHIPSSDEWIELCTCLGSSIIAGGKLKCTGIIEDGSGLWYSPNEGATNESGFSALPGGYCSYNGGFSKLGHFANYWLSTEFNPKDDNSRFLKSYDNDLAWFVSDRGYGFSVRCVKD